MPLSLATFNLWFDEFSLAERCDGLLAELAAESPLVSIIGLQEVTAAFDARLRAAMATPGSPLAAYAYSGVDSSFNYGTAALALSALSPAFSRRALPSDMGRDLLLVSCATTVVGVVHLESLNSPAARAAQLGVIAAVLGEVAEVGMKAGGSTDSSAGGGAGSCAGGGADSSAGGGAGSGTGGNATGNGTDLAVSPPPQPPPLVALVGDFNFCSHWSFVEMQAHGSRLRGSPMAAAGRDGVAAARRGGPTAATPLEGAPAPRASPSGAPTAPPLENNVLARTLPLFTDAWPAVSAPNDPGFTFDSTRNTMLLKYEQMRYDRVLVHLRGGWRITRARLLGTRALRGGGPVLAAASGFATPPKRERPVFASDHFGLRVDLDVAAA